MVIKYEKSSRVKLCQNKLILIISDNFDRKVCNEYIYIYNDYYN